MSKMDLKKVFICGGTGFLGYYSLEEFRRQGVQVGVMALPGEGILNADFWPKDVDVHEGFLFNLFKMNKDLTEEERAKNITHEQKVEMFRGYDAMVYAVGPDDRVHSPKGASAYDYFYEKLVTEVADTFEAAKEAGVKKAVLLNSYFAYFDRVGIHTKEDPSSPYVKGLEPVNIPADTPVDKFPEGGLAASHPYVRVRVRQANKMMEIGAGGAANGGMDIVVLELPYIFGNMPKRVPLWKNVFLDRFAGMPACLFPKGGTNMIHVNGIAEAVVAATFYGEHGDRLPVGHKDRTFKYMINKMMEDCGAKKRFMGVPCWMATIGGKMVWNDVHKANQDCGLDYRLLMKHIQSRFLYNEAACLETRKHLHFDEFGYNGGGDLDEGIYNTMVACYPHRYNFDENGKATLKPEFQGVNFVKDENAKNNKLAK